MNWRAMVRPKFVLRPAQIGRRLACELPSTKETYKTVRLPWGLPIRVRPAESIGAVIRHRGVHDLPVCELISRLIEPGELAVDAGANIGQMTGLMAVTAGPRGKVTRSSRTRWFLKNSTTTLSIGAKMRGQRPSRGGTWR